MYHQSQKNIIISVCKFYAIKYVVHLGFSIFCTSLTLLYTHTQNANHDLKLQKTLSHKTLDKQIVS